MNVYYLSISIILLLFFIFLSIYASPELSPEDSVLVNADKFAFLTINKSHLPILDWTLVYLSEFGREYFWIPVLALIFVFGGWIGKKTAVITAISFAVLILIAIPAKNIIHRERPLISDESCIMKSGCEISFPSGHAVIVSAGAINALILFNGSGKKKLVSMGLTVEAGLVCFSRVYVGAHYPLDILGGITLGIAISLVFIAFANNIEIVMKKIANIMG